MQVLLRNPSRTIEMHGPMRVSVLLRKLEVNRESVLVIENGTLVPGDAEIADDATVEIRSVISGGSGDADVTGGSQ